MIFRAFVSALALSAVVSATQFVPNITQLLTDTPKCALPCVLNGLTSANCTLIQIHDCLCRNITFQSSLSECVQKACVFQDQVAAVNVETGLCADTPKESRSGEVRVIAITMSVITFPIVALRCFSRWNVSRQIWWDDYAVLIATAFLIMLSGIEIASASMGFGRHYWNVSVDEGTSLLKMFYAVQIFYIMIQVFAKISILLLYLRVFPRPWFKMAVKILIAFMASHGFAFAVVIIFQCVPISSIWDRTIEGRCLDLKAIGYTGAVFSIVEDLLILVLPISELNTLSFGIRKRVSLMLMFSIGSFACVTSMVRLKYLVAFGNSYDSTWDNVDIVIWSMIEEYTALICACLPSLRPLLVQYLPGIFKSVTLIKSKSKSKSNGDSSYRMHKWKPSLGKMDAFGHLSDETAGGSKFKNESSNASKVMLSEAKERDPSKGDLADADNELASPRIREKGSIKSPPLTGKSPIKPEWDLSPTMHDSDSSSINKQTRFDFNDDEQPLQQQPQQHQQQQQRKGLVKSPSKSSMSNSQSRDRSPAPASWDRSPIAQGGERRGSLLNLQLQTSERYGPYDRDLDVPERIASPAERIASPAGSSRSPARSEWNGSPVSATAVNKELPPTPKKSNLGLNP